MKKKMDDLLSDIFQFTGTVGLKKVEMKEMISIMCIFDIILY